MVSTSETILEVVAQALESAFVTLEPAGPDAAAPREPVMLSLEIGKPPVAVTELAAGKEFGAYLAANILACDPSDPTAMAQADDALKEILNIASGLYLMRLGEETGNVPEMGLPRVSAMPAGTTWSDLAAKAESGEGMLVLADGHPLFARIRTVAGENA